MKIIIAPDSFKESLSAQQVASAIARGFREVLPNAELLMLPVADGGEGTTEALLAATSGIRVSAQVTGPLGQPVEAFWGLLGESSQAGMLAASKDKVAVIEMAAASGLDWVPPKQRNPLITTSRGTGELILVALDQGVTRFIIGLGGSATNDAGVGMLQALGVRFLDQAGHELAAGGGALSQLCTIDLTHLDKRLAQAQFEVACDVDNPLTGASGASAVFGPQKGATPEQVSLLDANLAHFAALTQRVTGNAIEQVAGAGAAGGLGGAFLGYLNADLRSGIDIVLDAVGFDQHLQGAALVIAGEGRMDSQSIYGKTPIGVSQRVKAVVNVPVIALAGSLAKDVEVVYAHGVDAVFSVVQGVSSLEQALAEAEENVYRTALNVARVFVLSREVFK